MNFYEILDLAKRGERLPQGCGTSAQMAYQAICYLIERCKLGKVPDDKAREELQAVRAEYERGKNVELYAQYSAQLWRDLGAAASAYQKDKTFENMDKMFEIIYGMKPNEKGENAKYEA